VFSIFVGLIGEAVFLADAMACFLAGVLSIFLIAA